MKNLIVFLILGMFVTSCAGFHPIAECKAMCKSGQVTSYKDEVVECVCNCADKDHNVK